MFKAFGANQYSQFSLLAGVIQRGLMVSALISIRTILRKKNTVEKNIQPLATFVVKGQRSRLSVNIRYEMIHAECSETLLTAATLLRL